MNSLSSSNLVKKLVDLLLLVVEVALGLRLILKLFGASTVSPFVRWVYETTDPLLEPFRGMFPSPVTEQGLVLEFSTLFAIVIYAFLAWIVMEIVSLVAKSIEKSKNENSN